MNDEVQQQMRARVMRRVYLMYCGRQVCKPVPRAMILGVLALILAGSVSLYNVLSNAFNTNGIDGLFNFLFTAFTDTSIVVQVITLAVIGMIGWFVWDTASRLKIMRLAQ